MIGPGGDPGPSLRWTDRKMGPLDMDRMQKVAEPTTATEWHQKEEMARLIANNIVAVNEKALAVKNHILDLMMKEAGPANMKLLSEALVNVNGMVVKDR